MKVLYIILVFGFTAFFTACDTKDNAETNINPPSEGFNEKGSDPKAIAIADSVMNAMGGRKAWDTTRFIKWNFFGRRDLLWDKKTGNVRISSPYDSTLYLINVKQDTGSVYIKNTRIKAPDSLQKLLQKAKGIWINDSYWLVMPFKLKDSGVTLKYLREDSLKSGATADVLQLTFENVGNTPQNKYEVYVDKKDHLVKQWAYFAEASQEEPSAIWPWDNYHDIAGLKLSFDRSDDGGPGDVVIYSDVPESVFLNPATPQWSQFSKLE